MSSDAAVVREEERERMEGRGWFLPSQRLPGGSVPRGRRVSAETSLGARSDAPAFWLQGADLLGVSALTGCVPVGACTSEEQ